MKDHTNTIEPAADSKLVGIKGWLILPAVSLILGAIVLTINLITMLAAFFSLVKTGNNILSVNEIIVAIILLVLVLYTATRFFARKSDAPYITILLMVVNVFLLGPLFAVEFYNRYFEGFFTSKNLKVLMGCVIYAAIWIPYFLKSKRVKLTFVR